MSAEFAERIGTGAFANAAATFYTGDVRGSEAPGMHRARAAQWPSPPLAARPEARPEAQPAPTPHSSRGWNGLAVGPLLYKQGLFIRTTLSRRDEFNGRQKRPQHSP